MKLKSFKKNAVKEVFSLMTVFTKAVSIRKYDLKLFKIESTSNIQIKSDQCVKDC